MKKKSAFVLSFISGFVDTAGFIALGGVFTAHVTGNFVLAGASLVRASTEGVLVKLAMFPIFLGAVALSYWLACFLDRQNKNALLVLMLIESFLLLLFTVVGFYFQPDARMTMTEMQIFTAGALGVTAMAVQNAFMKLYLSKMTMTTVMTGNVTQFSIDLVKLGFGVFNPAEEKEAVSEVRLRLTKVGTVLLGFLFGAIAGAFLFVNFALAAIIVPFFLLLMIAFRQQKQPD